MIYHDETFLENICINFVGNQTHHEALVTTDEEAILDDEMKELLKNYFLKPFKTDILFEFYDDLKLENNQVYNSVQEIFKNPAEIASHSSKLANLLFEASINPRTKGGEFYICYFNNVILKGESCDAIGFFKSENKDTFLQISPKNENFFLETAKGINLNKLDKGCVIFNNDEENGYTLSIVDGTSKAEASYWMDEFLQVQQKKDNYFDTQETLTIYKNFITKKLPEEFEISKVDQADFLNKTMDFFKEKKQFDFEEFTTEVLKDASVIESFGNYKSDYEQEMQVSVSEDFAINNVAVKKQASSYKSIIKLDKNFHIYVHGNRNLIQQGSDENGKFYQLYYEKED
jgi:hypothetical protein